VTLFAIYVVPLIPVYALELILKPPEGFSLAGNVLNFLDVLITNFASYPATVAVSEYCLGIKPSFQRSYARAFVAPGRLLGTFLLSSFLIGAGVILFVIPGVILSVWYMFAGPVVVLEALGGMAALKRSRELGRGFYLRNFGIGIVTFLIPAVPTFIFLLALAYGFELLGKEYHAWGDVLSSLVQAAFIPADLAALVLIYYDMRARKEGYGAMQLAEDIRT
jgi:hypothetical protein